MFPRSSIKRLRFAFAAMAVLTLLASVIGYMALGYVHVVQKRFLAETVPLMVDVEKLSKLAIRYSLTLDKLETVDSVARLNGIVTRYEAQSSALQEALLGLAKRAPSQRAVDDLNNNVRQLRTLETPYIDALRSKIETVTNLERLHREVSDEGHRLLERLDPFLLDASLRLIELAETPADDQAPAPEALHRALNEVRLLTNIGFATDRFLMMTRRKATNASVLSTAASNESLTPEIHELTRLISQIRNEDVRLKIANSLAIFNEKAMAKDGMVDERQRLDGIVAKLDDLNQKKIVLLTRMTNLVNRFVVDSRNRFFERAEAAETGSMTAFSLLTFVSTISFLAVLLIGWRLINQDIAKRLERLAKTTVALAEGNLDVDIDQSGSDELAEMGRSAEIFRRNALELRRTETELADRLVELERFNEMVLSANAALDTANADLAETELRYELAVKGSSVGIWDVNVLTQKVYWSDRYKEIVGIDDDLVWRSFKAFHDCVHPDDRERVIGELQNHIDSGDIYNTEYRLRRPCGTYLWIHARGQAIWDEAGKATRVAGSIDDITERKAVEIRLINYAKELERSNRELDDFAYIASHDLKEPLRAIHNHANFLIEDYHDNLGEDGQKRLGRMIKLSKRMEKLIADLLYFSRLGRGEQTMETIDPIAVIAGIETNLAETLASRHARIDIAEPLPSIVGHPAHITALFQNLIVNGIKYNDAEEVVIEIGSTPAAEGKGLGPFETFYVKDNGIGIDEEFQDSIFRIFKRLNSEKAYGEGTGAGLTFVKKIVENHGGRIWLQSEAGEGTTFFFTLQREAAPSAPTIDHHAA